MLHIGIQNLRAIVDDVKVYNTTLTEEQVQAEDKEYYESVLQEKVDAVSADSLLGLNDSADAVEFDLVLPETNGKWSCNVDELQ